MALTKAHLIETIRSNNGLTKNQSSDIIESTIDITKDTLASGKDVLISGFGKFCVKHKAERKGRNPATGDDMMLTPRRVVTFKCSGKLRGRGSVLVNNSISRCQEKSMNYNWKRQGEYLSYSLLVSVIICMMVGCSATGKTFVPSTPKPDSGMIYIYRTSRFLGSGNVWDLSVNGVRVTAVKNGGWLAYDSKPGSVTFFSKLRPGIGTLLTAPFMSEQEMITINVEAGEVYFVKFDHAIKGPYMELVDKDTGESEIAKLKMIEPLE